MKVNSGVRAGLIGHPVGHSKSPLIHRYWLEKYGIDGSYDLYDVLPDDLNSQVESLVASGIAGFNVTVPHKQAIMKLCRELDETAREIGAVNTVRVLDDGSLCGRNTDAFGFIMNIREQAPDFDFAKGPALVLGAGGAARAVIFALLKEGVPEIILANRTTERARALANGCPDPSRVRVIEWHEKEAALGGASLLVNTTSAGMAGMAPLDIGLENLRRECVVHDIVYAPLYTELLLKSKALGNLAVTGAGMLLHQARPAFEAWFGIMPEVTLELREKVMK